MAPALQVDSLLSELSGKPNFNNPAIQIHPLHFQDLHTPSLSVEGPLRVRRRLPMNAAWSLVSMARAGSAKEARTHTHRWRPGEEVWAISL